MALSSLFSFFDRRKPAQPSPDDEAAQKDRSEDPKPMPALTMEPAAPPSAPSAGDAAPESTSPAPASPPRILKDALAIYGVGRAPEVEKTENYTPDSPLLHLLHPQAPEPPEKPQAADGRRACAATAEAAGADEALPVEEPGGIAPEARHTPEPTADSKATPSPAPVAEAIPFGDLATEEAFAAQHPESAPKRRRRRAAKSETAPASPQNAAQVPDEAAAPKGARKRRTHTAKTAREPSAAAGAPKTPKKKTRRRRKPAPLDDALKAEALAAFQKGGAVEAVARTLQLPRSVVSAWMDEYLAGTLLSKKEERPEGAPQQDALF